VAVLDVAAAPVEGGGPTLPLWGVGKGGDVLASWLFALFCFVLRVASLIIVKATLCRGGIDGLSSQIKGGKVSIRIPQNSSRKRLREVFVDSRRRRRLENSYSNRPPGLSSGVRWLGLLR